MGNHLASQIRLHRTEVCIEEVSFHSDLSSSCVFSIALFCVFLCLFSPLSWWDSKLHTFHNFQTCLKIPRKLYVLINTHVWLVIYVP